MKYILKSLNAISFRGFAFCKEKIRHIFNEKPSTNILKSKLMKLSPEMDLIDRSFFLFKYIEFLNKKTIEDDKIYKICLEDINKVFDDMTKYSKVAIEYYINLHKIHKFLPVNTSIENRLIINKLEGSLVTLIKSEDDRIIRMLVLNASETGSALLFKSLNAELERYMKIFDASTVTLILYYLVKYKQKSQIFSDKTNLNEELYDYYLVKERYKLLKPIDISELIFILSEIPAINHKIDELLVALISLINKNVRTYAHNITVNQIFSSTIKIHSRNVLLYKELYDSFITYISSHISKYSIRTIAVILRTLNDFNYMADNLVLAAYKNVLKIEKISVIDGETLLATIPKIVSKDTLNTIEPLLKDISAKYKNSNSISD